MVNTVTVQNLKEQVQSSACTTYQSEAQTPNGCCLRYMHNETYWERGPLSFGFFPPIEDLSLDPDYTTHLGTAF